MSAGRLSGKIVGTSVFGFKIGTQPSQKPTSTKDERSIEQLSALVQQRPGDWTVENELADALLRAGRIDEAITRLCDTGERLATEGFFAKAHALFKKVVRLQPHNEYAVRRVDELTAERINNSAVRIAPRGGDMADARQAAAVEPPEPVAESPVPEEQSWTAAENTVDTAIDTAVEESPGAEGAAEPEFAASTDDLFMAQNREIDDERDEPVSNESISNETGWNESSWNESSWSEQPHEALSDSEGEVAAAPSAEGMNDAELEESRDTVNATVEFLKESARTYPDQIEPVARLAEFAASAGLEDVLEEAQARLCDLHARAGNFAAARTMAEALVARDPDNPRHRARLDFIMGELESGEIAAEPAIVEEVEQGWQTGQVEEVGQVEQVWQVGQVEEEASPEATLQQLLAMDVRAIASDERALADARLTLEGAMSDPHNRFAAARQLARLAMETGDPGAAMGWLESAAAGPLTAEEEEELAYEMGVVLEGAGEFDRALGVFQEVAAKAGPDYRDVSERIRQLSSPGDSRTSPSEQFLAV